MKKLLIKDTKYLNHNLALLLGRISIAVLMLVHGLPKMQALLSGNVHFPPVFGLSAELSLGMAVFAEVFCSILILVGLGTRAATIPLIITMLVAVFSIHAADVFAKKEPALLYLMGYVVLLFAGAGKYSLDYLLFSKEKSGGALPVKGNKTSVLNYL